ncbi:hypothetical protein SODALDRAFT_332168 [Sodiomyces alkalinus F11]|uniref:BTB domain-containing protein n=1 Tax=Sodiomyces alkalinus (strain CBS 110278 / VKM F-3762 / F11) TaxID=1314773 RepID=A0A3N2Q005_SODAK|nr:hypothetical protein SODALDRAFT_332168 [Sodiomyces alkalinus F11]ROT40018.1 hypothetical protein SODALDRAFT_332168 [Sodiomyces alkalinus F11]
MATPLDNRPRPSLKPLWTPYYDLRGGSPRSPLRSARAFAFSPSPRSPKTLPTPVYPPASHDGTMRQHERSMADRLDHMVRQARKGADISPPGSASVSRPMSPMSGPLSGSGRLQQARPLPTPASPVDTFPRRQTLVAETRSMLLVGVSALDDLDRRQSVPTFRPPGQSRKARQTMHLEQLRAWGHVYLGDATTADVFVTAVAVRRPSESGSSSSSSSSLSSTSPSEPTGNDETKLKRSLSLHPGPTTIRARVRPRDLDKKPFLIQREFDLEELRATVPDPLPRPNHHPAPKTPLGRRSSVAELPGPAAMSQQHALRPLRARRRSSSAKYGLLPSGHGLRSGSNRDARASARGSSAVPIHLEYARAHLPVLAALIVSGHIREGDVIDLPMSHPEAWSQTVAYVYTGQGELTDAIKENILYLAGKA